MLDVLLDQLLRNKVVCFKSFSNFALTIANDNIHVFPIGFAEKDRAFWTT